MRKKDREKRVEKNAYFDAHYSNKTCVHLALFFTDLRCRKCFKKIVNLSIFSVLKQALTLEHFLYAKRKRKKRHKVDKNQAFLIFYCLRVFNNLE
jgi:deoxycytidylate deaminase